MSKASQDIPYELKIIWRNGAGEAFESRHVSSDEDLKIQLIDLVTNATLCAGDTISIEASE